jgi:serine/threonine protein phosphatase PrpC
MTSGHLFQCVSAGSSHVGRIREQNQDAYLDRSDLGLWVVADGVGGHNLGAYASKLIVSTLATMSPPSSAPDLFLEVRSRLLDVNRRLVAKASAHGPNVTIASTVVALLVYRGHYACVWAGDSRLYLLRDERFEQISRDHSEVQELVDNGILSAEDAARHPASNIVTRALGAEEDLDLEVRQDWLRAGDRFLLCSDGVTKVLLDEEIREMVEGHSVEGTVRSLIDAALERGAPDNVTAVLVHCQQAPTVQT